MLIFFMIAVVYRQKSFDSIIFMVASFLEKFNLLKNFLRNQCRARLVAAARHVTSRLKNLIAFFHAACLSFYFFLSLNSFKPLNRATSSLMLICRHHRNGMLLVLACQIYAKKYVLLILYRKKFSN